MDKTTILASVEKTHKLLIIHEDNKFGGIGAEISAMVAEEALFHLDAPIRRLNGLHTPTPYSPPLEAAIVRSIDDVRLAFAEWSIPTREAHPRQHEEQSA